MYIDWLVENFELRFQLKSWKLLMGLEMGNAWEVWTERATFLCEMAVTAPELKTLELDTFNLYRLIWISTLNTSDCCSIRSFWISLLCSDQWEFSLNVRQKEKNISASDWPFGFLQTPLRLVESAILKIVRF